MSEKIILITLGDENTASSRYRAIQYVPLLRQAGFTVVHLQKPSMLCILKQLSFSGATAGRPIIWIQKKILSIPKVWLLSFFGQIFFDFDDAIWTTEKGKRSFLTRTRVRVRLSHLIRASRSVIVGNSYLASYAIRWNKNTYILPTAVDIGIYPIKVHVPTDKITVGWIGHSRNFGYLLALEEVFRKLNKLIRFRLMIIADREFVSSSKEVEIVNRRWSKETELNDLIECDLGIMPLPHDEWALGKCAFKAIQYMACGIPALVTPTEGANQNLIQDKKDGYHCCSEEEWLEVIIDLAKNVDLRHKIGAAGRAVIEKTYSTAAVYPQLGRILTAKPTD